MTNLIAAIILTIWLAGFGVAQGPSKRGADTTNKIEIAVVEFTPTGNATVMTYEAKRHLQASIAFSLYETKEFDVVDVRNTREATKANLAAINGDASTAAAVRAGKSLGVKYVLTGMVTEYTPKGPDNYGSAEVKVRLIEVATGKIKYSGAISARSGKPLRVGSAAEMHSQVLKHVIDQIAVLVSESI